MLNAFKSDNFHMTGYNSQLPTKDRKIKDNMIKDYKILDDHKILDDYKLFKDHKMIEDRRNERIIVNSYAYGTSPSELSRYLIDYAERNCYEKIWLWALPADVPVFLRKGFKMEASLFRGSDKDFCISLAYFLKKTRSMSKSLDLEKDIIQKIRIQPVSSLKPLPAGMDLRLLDDSFAPQISRLLTSVFTTYPSPIEDSYYLRSLIQEGNLFAGAIYQGELIAVSAAYPDLTLKRCEMTDCATLEDYRGYSLIQRLLIMLEQEISQLGNLTLYTLARAQSYAMNRVFHKLKYNYQGRLINNCHIAGSYEDMNLWVR